jgi:hypothetical protein
MDSDSTREVGPASVGQIGAREPPQRPHGRPTPDSIRARRLGSEGGKGDVGHCVMRGRVDAASACQMMGVAGPESGCQFWRRKHEENRRSGGTVQERV